MIMRRPQAPAFRDGRVGQLLHRSEDVQRRADPGAGPLQQSQPRPGLVPLGDIHDRRSHPQEPPSRVIRPEKGDQRSDLSMQLVARAPRQQDIAPGHAGFQHLTNQGLDAFGLLLQTEGTQHLRQRAAEEFLNREGSDVARSGVEMHETQPGIQNVQAIGEAEHSGIPGTAPGFPVPQLLTPSVLQPIHCWTMATGHRHAKPETASGVQEGCPTTRRRVFRNAPWHPLSDGTASPTAPLTTSGRSEPEPGSTLGLAAEGRPDGSARKGAVAGQRKATLEERH